MSRQHLQEFAESGMDAELFSKDGRTLFSGQGIEIIDINKLKDDMGVKTVAIDAFEGNNLVLVDEGHRGSSGEDWKAKRDKLCEDGFSFEYSATFGQAMKAAKNAALTQEYAKCIVFDYSYKYFYRDGYGKDYQILNLANDTQEDIRQLYLTACLLVFYQQVRLHHDQRQQFAPFLIESPLWVFVGGSVTQGTSTKELSDIEDILLFLANFTHQRNRAINVSRIERLLRGQAGLLDNKGRDIFANTFAYLLSTGQSADDIFHDVLRQVFGSPTTGALHVDGLKGVQGEIALRVGTNEPFGVINVGDTATLLKNCQAHDELVVGEQDFATSLFARINTATSPIKLLIGARKFTEGWNSWRVSTMGLLNIGKKEGSQIIQLFGRGVRLKGYGFSLKRSRKIQHEQGMQPPKRIDVLETLNIFGIRADYMQQFKEYLDDEGLPANEQRTEIVLPVLRTKHENNLSKLRVIRVKPGIDFKKKGPKPTLGPFNGMIKQAPISVDWYPKIQAQRSKGTQATGDVAVKHHGMLTTQHLAFMDMSTIFFELEQFKNERAWHNFNVSPAAVRALLEHPDWYQLLIPDAELAFTGFDRVRVWQKIAVALLKKYCDKYYKYRKSEYEMPHLEYVSLSANDPNMITQYSFLIEDAQQSIITELQQLRDDLAAGQLRGLQINNLEALPFDAHLYEPLIHVKNSSVEVRPVALNEGERNFVADLRTFHQNRQPFFAGKEVYLLRNQSRGRGIGFFEAGNFYPDFILWLLIGNHQYVTFVDPKGLRNLRGVDDPKIGFAQQIKELETRLGNANVTLNSCIVAPTKYADVAYWRDETGQPISRAAFEQRHVFFQENKDYIEKLLNTVFKQQLK